MNDTTEILKQLRKEIEAVAWEKIADDGHTLLISKPEVLAIIREWIEYSLETV